MKQERREKEKMTEVKHLQPERQAKLSLTQRELELELAFPSTLSRGS
jgi:hypothetical protein